MDGAPMEARSCRAHSSRTSEPCQKYPIAGSTVCRSHGGSAPQVKRKAAERLLVLQPPAIDALERALAAEARQLDRRGEIRTLGPDRAAQTRAATAVLDRTGIGPSSTSNVNLRAGERLAELIELLDAEG